MEETIKYFQNYKGYFWQWETDHDAMEFPEDVYNLLSIPHVSVIAYRKYALEILKMMEPAGIPPFGAFLLALYASGNFKFSNFDGLNYYLSKTEKEYGGLVNKQAVLDFLNSIYGLPEKLKTGENKILLLQTIFHNCHHEIASPKARLILKGIEDNETLISCAGLMPFNESAYIRDLYTLELLNRKFPNSASIIKAMQGLPQLPEPEEEIVEQEAVPAEKDFIDLLIEEPKTFEVGKLIRRIWSGLKIPMQHFSPGDQPVGGISDMTNKGNIDRMLLSEFAYDDDIFLQRVANNEALYIQREIPPEKNVFERILLIDISLRSWGTPKILAFATALAIARHPKAKDECRIFLAGKSIREIKHEKVEDIIDALALVAPVADCSAGLLDFFKDDHGSAKREIFLLAAEDSFKLPAVQKILSDYREQFKFVVCFTANGIIQFFKMQQGAKRLLQTILLPLEDLWKKSHTKQRVSQLQTDTDYPILFTAGPNDLGGFYLDGEYYFLSRKKILYKTYLPERREQHGYYYYNFKGWEPVVKNISLKPKGSFALGKNVQNELLLCQYNDNDKILSVLNLFTKKYLSVKYKVQQYYTVVFDADEFYLFNNDCKDYQKILIGEDELVLSPSEEKDKLQLAYLEQQKEVNRARGYRRDILTNHSSVGITEEGFLQFSKHCLLVQHEKLVFINRRPELFKAVAVRNGNSFMFDEGSCVFVDNEGMITLRSSNPGLPDIFIPSCVGHLIAAATANSFCGEDYYLPKNHQFSFETVDAFYEKYIKEFIQQILVHADTA